MNVNTNGRASGHPSRIRYRAISTVVPGEHVVERASKDGPVKVTGFMPRRAAAALAEVLNQEHKVWVDQVNAWVNMVNREAKTALKDPEEERTGLKDPEEERTTVA